MQIPTCFFFRVKKSSSNKEELCMNCYDQATEDNDKLATSLMEGKNKYMNYIIREIRQITFTLVILLTVRP